MTFNLVDNVYQIARSEVKTLTPDWRWMVVTSIDPLRIRFDAEDDPLDLTPDAITSDFQVGDRVLVKIQSGQLPVVLGKSGVPQYIYAGALGSTSESALILRRVVGGAQMEYGLVAGSGEQASITVAKNGEYHSILRVGRNGQLAVQTNSVSGTTGAIRPIPFAVQTGVTNVAGGGANSATSSVTFSSGRFTAPPVVMTSSGSNTTSLGAYTTASHNTSVSGCTVRVTREGGATWTGTVPVNWIAIQLEV